MYFPLIQFSWVKTLSFEKDPITTLDRYIRKLRTREIASLNVQWKRCSIDEETWVTQFNRCATYPQLF